MAQQTQRRPDNYDWIIPMEVMLGSINHKEVQACSISTVSDELRNSKEEAYSPKAVSIGPLHKEPRNNLQLMEELKWRYTLSLLGKIEKLQAKRFRNAAAAMADLDSVVRASYGDTIKFEPQDLAKIMLVDGCFVLEFLFRLKSHREGEELEDPIFMNEEKLFSVLNDLTLLENQIPFIVLKKLYRKIFPDDREIEDDHRVADLVLSAFGYNRVHASGIAHLLHLIHLSNVEPENNQDKRASQELKRCATKLRAAGLTIRPANYSIPDDNKFVDKFDFNINFNDDGVLEIPALHIKETTEVKWRNLIAWEQSKIGIRSKFTSYALFFRGLICCEHDIELLHDNRVLLYDSGKTKEDLLTMFRTITNGAEHMDWSYSDLCGSLNKYPTKKKVTKLSIITWHLCRSILAEARICSQNLYDILTREHIPNLWKFIGVLTATALLALTIMQTYYAAQQNQK